MTARDLARLPDACGRFELLDGRLVELSPAGHRHNELIVTIGAILFAWIRPRKLGVLAGGDTGVLLRRNPDRVRAPDLCFTLAERLPNHRAQHAFTDIIPDFVVEIVSPNDTAGEVQQKVEEWLQAGVRLVWTVFPETHTVGVSTSLAATRYVHEGDLLDAEPVLPGFAVAVAELFAELE